MLSTIQHFVPKLTLKMVMIVCIVYKTYATGNQTEMYEIIFLHCFMFYQM
jgi:hypothetical protein